VPWAHGSRLGSGPEIGLKGWFQRQPCLDVAAHKHAKRRALCDRTRLLGQDSRAYSSALSAWGSSAQHVRRSSAQRVGRSLAQRSSSARGACGAQHVGHLNARGREETQASNLSVMPRPRALHPMQAMPALMPPHLGCSPRPAHAGHAYLEAAQLKLQPEATPV